MKSPSRNLRTDVELARLRRIVEGAVGPSKLYCTGYGTPGASGLGSVAAVLIAFGSTDNTGEKGLADIRAFDDASSTGTFIGEVNMVQATSFAGVETVVWGLDVARSKLLGRLQPLFRHRFEGDELPIFDMLPLLRASRLLLGTRLRRGFRIQPGAVVTAAMKGRSFEGPCVVWAAMAIAVPCDRARSACLFLEDMGALAPRDDLLAHRAAVLDDIARTAVAVGVHNDTPYDRVYATYQASPVAAGRLGAVKTQGPYLLLARNAVPPGGAGTLVDISLEQWFRATNHRSRLP